MSCLSEPAALGKNLWTTGSMYRAVDSASAKERRVRGVDNRGDVLSGYVAGNDGHASFEKRVRHDATLRCAARRGSRRTCPAAAALRRRLSRCAPSADALDR